jgi:hypothetical protein
MAHGVGDDPQLGDVAQQHLPAFDVAAHDVPLRRAERARLVEHLRGDRDLADVVDEAGQPAAHGLRGGAPKLLGDLAGQVGQAVELAAPARRQAAEATASARAMRSVSVSCAGRSRRAWTCRCDASLTRLRPPRLAS